MSNFLAIATVTAALQQLLQGPVKNAVNSATVGFARPDGSSGQQTALVNLYLYQVTPNAAYRNADTPTRRLDGTLVQRPQVALDLHTPQRTVLVETLGPGTVLGWSWLFPPYRWHFGATALVQTLAVELDGPGVRELCARDPVLGHDLMSRFLAVVVDRMQATRVRLLDLYRSPL